MNIEFDSEPVYGDGDNSPLNLRRRSVVVVPSIFFLKTAKFCRRDNFDIICKSHCNNN